MNWLRKHWLYIYIVVIEIVYTVSAIQAGKAERNSTMIEVGTVVTAIIGVIGVVAGAAIGGWFSNRGTSVKDVKKDTEYIKPVIAETSKTASAIHKCIVEDIRLDIRDSNKAVGKIEENLKVVVDDVEYRKRLGQEKAGRIEASVIHTGVDALVEDNVSMKKRLAEAEQIIERQREQIIELQAKVDRIYHPEHSYDKAKSEEFEM
ncbi:MAG: hypothetical protein Q4B78_03700 [Bacillota bacterium]|nr:hypothetical protein [Bacillota bacterium]